MLHSVMVPNLNMRKMKVSEIKKKKRHKQILTLWLCQEYLLSYPLYLVPCAITFRVLSSSLVKSLAK